MSDNRRKRYSAGLKKRTDSGENLNHQRSTNGPPSTLRTRNGNNFQRMNSNDRVRKIVQEEGRTARNLLKYSLPVSDGENDDIKRGRTAVRHPRKSHKSTSEIVDLSASYPTSSERIAYIKHSTETPPKSPKSDGGKKPDLRARYWKFLFDNLKRAVDAIYETCEQDESVIECKEVIMMLEQSTNDFKSLIERLNVLKAYENYKEGDRPTAIAWEVRKMSPGKGQKQMPHGSPSPNSAQRVLNFSPPDHRLNGPIQVQKPSVAGNSWADRVKGVKSNTSTIQQQIPNHITNIEEVNEDGWETVQRGGKSKSTRKSNEHLNKTDKRKDSTRKSTEHLNKAERRKEHRNLIRSKSEPSTAGDVQNEDSSQIIQKSASTELAADVGVMRQRADSKDSEKENRPQPSKSRSVEVPQELDISISTEESVNARISSYIYSENSNLMNHDKVNDDDEASEEHIDNAANELEAAQELALQSAIQEEQSWLKELAREESMTVDFDAEESELGLTNDLEAAQELALKSAIEEEESYLKEMAREESLTVEVDMDESELEITANSLDPSQSSLDWDTMVAEYDASDGKKSWGEMVEEADSDARTPGHGVHMHKKLSSPSRKSAHNRSPTESRRKHEEKQAKAQELRDKLLSEKADRLRDLSKKVEEVRAWKDELLRQKRLTIERKMHRAEKKRLIQLSKKARKAHDEELKANEIAFINSLEAQNRKHDILSKHQESEARLQDKIEERQRKHEEKQAKEAAVEERRKALQAERQARLTEMQEKRKQRDARVEKAQQKMEQERLEAARAKEKDREDRIAIRFANQQAHIQELQKKIQQKQDESSQRHQEALQLKRDKAFMMSVLRHSTEDHNDAPQITPYDKNKICTICNALIPSEVYLLSHLRGKKHQQALKDNSSGKTLSKHEIENFNLTHIVDAPDNSTHPKIASEKERMKSMKKRVKKLRQRMNTRGLEYESTLTGKQGSMDSEHKAKLQKIIKDINKYLQTPDTGPWGQNKVAALDRALGELNRILDKKATVDQACFRALQGLTSLSRIIQLIDTASTTVKPVIPPKSLILASNVIRAACKGWYDNCHYMLFCNKLALIVDLLIYQLTAIIPDERRRPSSGNSSSPQPPQLQPKLPYDPLAVSLMQLLTTVLSCLAKKNPIMNSSEASLERMSCSGDAFHTRGNDIISYIISVGVVDKLGQYFSSVRGPIEEDKDAADFLHNSLGFLTSMTKFMSKRNSNIFEKKKQDDPTQLITTFEVTEMVGILSLLYGMLLHSGAPSRGDAAPPELPQHTLSVCMMGLRMISHMALLDLPMVQKTVGAEGLSLQFRHICSFLIWYCTHHSAEELLHEVILCVGYFTIQNTDNQVIIQSGTPPTVLQQLCALPIQYFCDPRLTNVIFPTLIACCYKNQLNQEILEQELSCTLLANYIEEKQLELQQSILFPSGKKNKSPEKDKAKESDNRFCFHSRFPAEAAIAAQEYFKV